MRKLLLSLALTLALPFVTAAKDVTSLYLKVLNEHVVKMESDEMYCTAFKVEKEEFLTARHCIVPETNASSARLFDQFGIAYMFEVVKQSEGLDLALLHAKIPTKTPIKFATELKAGEPVLGIGFIYIFMESVVPSSILANVLGTSSHGLVGIDHSYKKGFSGGPLVNMKGELVGLNDMTDSAHDVGLAIATPVITYFLNEE